VAMGAKRIMMAAALATGLGVLAASPAFAGEGAGTSQPEQAKINEGRRVCRNIVPSGSRLTTRICKTKAEWDRAMDRTQESVLQQQMTTQSGYEQGKAPF
jgi:hypothetical protein